MHESLPFNWRIIQDTDQNHSCVCLLFHHAWMDGMPLVSKFYMLQQSWDREKEERRAEEEWGSGARDTSEMAKKLAIFLLTPSK